MKSSENLQIYLVLDYPLSLLPSTDLWYQKARTLLGSVPPFILPQMAKIFTQSEINKFHQRKRQQSNVFKPSYRSQQNLVRGRLSMGQKILNHHENSPCASNTLELQ
jgi:hypothetical protein